MSATSSRMLTLLSLLQSRRDWPGSVLAERLDVSARTVRRDVDRLRELGYRIEAAKGPDGGYRLAAGAALPPLLFDDEQAVALAIALQNAPASGVDIEVAAERALATVRQVMPARVRHRLDGLRFVGTGARDHADPATLEAVSTAVRDRWTLRFEYGDEDAPGAAEPRTAEPHAVVARRGRWYLLAWDPQREDWRTFRLDRVRLRAPNGPRFTPRPIPTGGADTFLAARFKGSEHDDRWPCVGEVVVDLAARDLDPWVGDAEVEELSDGTCRVVAGSWSWTGLLAWVMRLDAPFRVVGPPALADAAGALAERLAAATP